jgi:pimeloyl-ACP methyl ester carboxylesterase
MQNIQDELISSNGIRLHVALAGPQDGPLVILLHGFPEFWYGWRNQIPFLAESGFRVWAPDQRGYNLSDKPPGIAAYSLDQLASDVIGLVDAAGCQATFLVGHDWGGGVAWWAAAKYPERIRRLVIINAPHVSVFRRAMFRDPAQMLKSWYFLALQVPWLPEALWRLSIRRGIPARMARNGMFTGGDPELYRRAWSQPGAMTGMINWYRAARQAPPHPLPDTRIQMSALLLWGSRDAYLRRELAEASIRMCDDGRLVYFEQATHWVHHEHAAEVSALIADFFKGSP